MTSHGDHAAFALFGCLTREAARTAAGWAVQAAADVEAPPPCPTCAAASPVSYGSRRIRLVDAPRDNVPVFWEITFPRFRCRTCRHVFSPALDAAHRSRRMTAGFVLWCRAFSPDTPSTLIAGIAGVSDKTVTSARGSGFESDGDNRHHSI